MGSTPPLYRVPLCAFVPLISSFVFVTCSGQEIETIPAVLNHARSERHDCTICIATLLEGLQHWQVEGELSHISCARSKNTIHQITVEH